MHHGGPSAIQQSINDNKQKQERVNNWLQHCDCCVNNLHLHCRATVNIVYVRAIESPANNALL